MDDLGDAGVGAGLDQTLGAVDVDRAQQVVILGQRHLGHVVEHPVGAVDRGPHRGAVTDVAALHLDPGRSAPVTSMSNTTTSSPRATSRSTSNWPK